MSIPFAKNREGSCLGKISALGLVDIPMRPNLIVGLDALAATA